MKKETAGIILLVLALSWTSCQNSPTAPPTANAPAPAAPAITSARVPTEQDGAQVLRNMLEEAHGNPRDVISFKKTDGAVDGNTYTLYGEEVVRLFNGQPMKRQVELKFTRTENGWHGLDGHAY